MFKQEGKMLVPLLISSLLILTLSSATVTADEAAHNVISGNDSAEVTLKSESTTTTTTTAIPILIESPSTTTTSQAPALDIKLSLTSTTPTPSTAPPAATTTTAPQAILLEATTTTSSPAEPKSTVSKLFADVKQLLHRSTSTTSSPAPLVVETTKTATSSPSISIVSPPSSSHSSKHDNETTHKFSEYIKPICESIDLIAPKQLIRLQLQFKQIAGLTNGKLDHCFQEHYAFIPKPVTKNELTIICASRDLPESNKGSYKSFQGCAAKNWNAAVDTELEHIILARLNCIKDHDHPKDGNAANLIHEDDAFSFINEIVSKVFGSGEKSLNNNSDVKVIDVGPSSTPKPLASSLLSTPVPSNKNNANNIMNDPNTVVVLMDDQTTLSPAHHDHGVGLNVKTSHTTTSKPTGLHLLDTLKAHSASTSAKPALIEISATTSTPTTHKMIIVTTTTTAAPSSRSSLFDKVISAVTDTNSSTTTTTTIAPSTTMVPSSKPTTTAAVNLTHSSVAVTASTVSTTTLKPAVVTLVTTKKANVASSTTVTSKVVLTTLAPATASKETVVKSKVVGPPASVAPGGLFKHPAASKETVVKSKVVSSPAGATSNLGGLIKAPVASKEVSVKSKVTSVAPKAPLPAQPLETLEQILKRQEKEKQEFEKRLKLERDNALKQWRKKQDEIEAQNAIRSLQLQRQATIQGSDTRLHQLEHNRQMAIDPIGHTMKHQQYEVAKQQRMSAL